MISENILKVITEAQQIYNEPGFSSPSLTDEQFDALVDLYENKKQIKLNLIGSRPSERVVELPYSMPSLDKIKGKKAPDELNRFINKHSNSLRSESNFVTESNFVIEDKLDGISILLVYTPDELKIYNRGDGINGQDVSFISNEIKFPDIKENIAIRGELILNRSVFEELQETMVATSTNKMKKARTLVSGAINKKNASNSILSKCHFYAFEIISNIDTPINNFKRLMEYGFNIPFYTILNPTIASLTDILDFRRKESPYEIDGLVIVSNQAIPFSNVNENPKHKIAFKIDTVVISIVSNIEWGLTSRYGYLTPVIHIEPIEILGSEVSKASGHNGRYIVDKQLGIGAVVEITLSGDIIPQVQNVIVPSANIPHPPVPYHWNENGVEVIVDNPNSYPQVQIEIISSFLNHLGIKSCGIKTIEKIFYGAGIQKIDQFISLQENQIAHLDRLGDKSASNICTEIKKGISNATYPKLMAATGIFGEGIGESRFEDFIIAFPSWKYVDITAEDIEKVSGFGPIMAVKISTNLMEFKEWFWSHPVFGFLENQVIKDFKQDLKGQVIVFSGFRDDTMEEMLKRRGAVIPSSLRKDTTILFVKSLSETSSKITEARSRGIRILEKTQTI